MVVDMLGRLGRMPVFVWAGSGSADGMAGVGVARRQAQYSEGGAVAGRASEAFRREAGLAKRNSNHSRHLYFPAFFLFRGPTPDLDVEIYVRSQGWTSGQILMSILVCVCLVVRCEQQLQRKS